MKEGLIWRSAPFLSGADNDNQWYRLVEVCGTLAADPKPVASKADQSTIGYTFSLKYGRKKYVNVSVWRKKYNYDYDYTLLNIAQTLEQHETVVIWGTVSYTPKDSIRREAKDIRDEMFRKRNFDEDYISERWFHQLDANMISPTPEDVLFIKQLRSSPAIQKVLNSDAADAMESLDDHAEEYQEEYVSEEQYGYEDEYEVTI